MKQIINLIQLGKGILTCMSFLLLFNSCSEDVLQEEPKDFLAPNNTFVNKSGFEAGLTALYANARETHMTRSREPGLLEKEWEVNYGQGADIGYHIDQKSFITDYSVVNSSNSTVLNFWRTYYSLVKDANILISRANDESAVWESDVEKNEIVAQARFFRAYAYRTLTWFWGDVPIIEEEIKTPKLDFKRNPASEVIDFILEDLKFASQNLPNENPDGARLSKAAADYLLAETYIVKKQWDEAISSVNRILDDSQYDLMRNRFGSMTDKPGDVYWDLFRLGNQDRSSGNKENIFAWQYEFNVDGGHYNAQERAWGPFLERLKTPDNMQAILKNDLLGRPVVFIRITPWVENEMWDDFDNDMRNSEFNVKREFVINNPESAFFGEVIEPTEDNYVRNMFPYYQKFTHPYGHPQGYDTSGRIYTDWYVFRVAGAYLLRAEAYLGKGDLGNAANDINKVRGRAGASPITSAEVDIDYILDERARELLGEEDRRVILNRTGKLLERTKLYNPVSGPTMQDFHNLFPIPQAEIDANKEAELTQNPGY